MSKVLEMGYKIVSDAPICVRPSAALGMQGILEKSVRSTDQVVPNGFIAKAQRYRGDRAVRVLLTRACVAGSYDLIEWRFLESEKVNVM